jgi:PTS system mannose-specific IIA component
MVGILIVAHSIYGEALLRSASHVLGKRPSRALSLGMTVRDDPDAVLARAREMAKQLDQGSGVLVLTDILGATPSNIATQLIIRGRVEVVAGVNLSMLVRALTYREEPLATVVGKAVSGGVEGVVHVLPEAGNAARRG